MGLPTSRRIEVRGVVQGVGFRPFVHRMATDLGLDGWVGNDTTMVFIDVAGRADAIDRLATIVATDPPPLAVVESVEVVDASVPIPEGSGFSIVFSQAGDAALGRTFVSPDTAVCDDCLREMADPTDRRFEHPFITCTNCGPRFTITRSLPYDRASTTMAGFPMCPACRAEYDDPTDRRFHAQPIGCHECGPRVSWQDADGASGADPVGEALALLGRGRVVAIKGLGGFHLAALATSDSAVATLRDRKHRPDKPFAVMVADLVAARELADLSDDEAQLLTGRERPIVLCRARGDSPLSALVAPGNPLIGIVLPYTPLHHLLFARGDLGPLVMTSGNVGGEPIVYRDDEVEDRLGHLVDGVLSHDRPIHVPCDDSVVRVTDRGILPIRRARGYAPMPLSLPVDITTDGADVDDTARGSTARGSTARGSTARSPGKPPVLAVGGELKNAFCVTNGAHAWMSQHIGDMENLATLEAFEASVAQFCDLYDIQPLIFAADTHPGYRSSGWARTNHGDRVAEVQHHHAHVAAVMAEHGIVPSVPVLGVVFDGTGDGTDGTIWGGELLVATAERAERVGHLRPTALPGGDAAIRHPWRVALSHLRTAGLPWQGTQAARAATPTELGLLAQQLDRNLGCVPTTSMGRFFDALASLVGVRHAISYEAQAAIEFEILAASWDGPTPTFSFSLSNPTALLADLCDAVSHGVEPAAIARACHIAMAEGVAAEVVALAGERRIGTVALTGGVFQNVLFTDLLAGSIEAAGLDVITHRLVPPNDGGLALGQAYVATARAAAHRSPEADIPLPAHPARPSPAHQHTGA